MRYFKFLVLLLLVMAGRSQAAVMLRTTGNGQRFQVKTIKVTTRFEKGLAQTSLVWTFAYQGEQWKPEVDFFYAAPPRSVVTFFAYWFGTERVVARVVEKERASAIYEQLSAWSVDPALIEYQGNNTFRARIFPVREGEDVRVEMHIVQPLEATSHGLKWTLPLIEPADSPERLSRWMAVGGSPTSQYQNVDVKIDASGMPGLGLSSNQAGLHWSGTRGSWKTKNWAATRDLVVSLRRPAKPLQADLYSSRASGRDGYFSLLLTANRAVSAPRLSIAGVKTSQLTPAKLPPLQPGQNVVVCGRYQGGGRARVRLNDLETSVDFRSTQGANNPAAKLWASRQILALGQGAQNRARIIALSKRWALPSPYTSWLAVPTAEKANFENAKKQIRKQTAMRNAIGKILMSNDTNAQKAQLARLGQQSEIYEQLYGLASQFARAHEVERLKDRPNPARLKQSMSQLERIVKLENQLSGNSNSSTVQNYIESERSQLVGQRSGVLADDYIKAFLYDGEASENAKKARATLDRFDAKAGQEGDAGTKAALTQSTWNALRVLSYEYLREKGRLEPNSQKMHGLEADMNRLVALSKTTKVPSYSYYSYYSGIKDPVEYNKADQVGPATQDAIRETLRAYREELTKDSPDPETLKRLREHSDELLQEKIIIPTRRTGFYGNWYSYGSYDSEHVLDPEFQKAESNPPTPDEKKELLVKLERRNMLTFRWGDPLVSVQAPANTRQIIALFPDGQIKKLCLNPVTGRFECRFDVPTYAAEGAYTVRIILLNAQGERSQLQMTFHVDLTAPGGKATFDNKAGAPRLVLGGDASTERVSAFTPWNERLELQRQPNSSRFEAPLFIPAEWQGRAAQIRFVVTDHAHNRTELSLDLSP